MTDGIKVQYLTAAQLAGSSNDPRLPAAEQIVLAALDERLDGQIPGELLLEAERLVLPRLIAQTGGIFVFEYEDMLGVTEAFDDVIYSASTTNLDLPPLPFPRCWFEFWSSDRGGPMLAPYTDWAHDAMGLAAVAIWEVEALSEWIVYGVARHEETQKVQTFRWRLVGRGHQDFPATAPPEALMALRLDGEIIEGMGEMDDEGRSLERLWMLPVILAQALHVVGVRREIVPIIRQTRRQHQRRFGVDHPQVYLVNMRDTGEQQSGNGQRRYYHRWLVRGHYRRIEGGRYEVPGRGSCAWIRPYVKGPVGAPWKGRPVHVT